MAEPFRSDYPGNPYRIDPIYLRMTQPRKTADDRSSLPSVQDLFGNLSVTSQYKVSMYFGDTAPIENSDEDLNSWLVSCGVLGSGLRSLRYEFMCNETTLPGSTLGLSEEFGSRQGLQETFANRRVFETISMMFYVDSEYGVIRLFEEWFNFINPLYGKNPRAISGSPGGSNLGRFDSSEFYRFRYPDTYKRNIAISKFERNYFVDEKTRAISGTSSVLTYYMINAYPTQITAIPVTYEGSTITKTTVIFNYDRYVTLKHGGTEPSITPQYQSTTTKNNQNILLTTPTIVTNAAPFDWSNTGLNSGIDPTARNFNPQGS